LVLGLKPALYKEMTRFAESNKLDVHCFQTIFLRPPRAYMDHTLPRVPEYQRGGPIRTTPESLALCLLCVAEPRKNLFARPCVPPSPPPHLRIYLSKLQADAIPYTNLFARLSATNLHRTACKNCTKRGGSSCHLCVCAHKNTYIRSLICVENSEIGKQTFFLSANCNPRIFGLIRYRKSANFYKILRNSV
jgi:hypothetical protein